MYTKLKTHQKGEGTVEILLIVAIVLVVGALFYNASRSNSVVGRGQAYDAGAIALAASLYQGNTQTSLMNPYTNTTNNYSPRYQQPQEQTEQPVYRESKPEKVHYRTSVTTPAALPQVTTYTTQTVTTDAAPTPYVYPYNNYSSYPATNYTSYPYNNSYNPNTYNYNTNNAPIITLLGNNPFTFYHYAQSACNNGWCPSNGAYNEPGYSARDNEDGDITSKVVITNEGTNYGYAGSCRSYTLRYTVTDSSNNTATARRTVNECYN